MAVSDYESPRVIDLGTFSDLTQASEGSANDGSSAFGSGGN